MMLLLMMIGLVLIVTFVVKTKIFTSSHKSTIEISTDAINDAKKAKQQLEGNYRFDPDAEEKSIDGLN